MAARRATSKTTTRIGGPAAIVAVLALTLPATAWSAPIGLQDYLFNVNGASYCPDAVCAGALLPPALDTSAFDFTTGLGSLAWTFAPGAAGTYAFDAFFDHDLHAPFFNEFGDAGGAPAAGVSWQIDEPGFGDGNRLGTIFDNAMANALDDTNHVAGAASNFLNDCGANGGGAPNPACNNDVSLALGFNFALAANQQALLTLTAGTVRPASGFFLEQIDPDAPGNNLYLSGSLAVSDASPSAVPEPGTLLLVASGVAAVARRARRWTRGLR